MHGFEGTFGLSPYIYIERSLTLGPKDTVSVGLCTATYRPNSHASLLGEVGSLPLYRVRGCSPLALQTRHPLCGQTLKQ